MPEYTSEFTDNVQQWTARIDAGLAQYEQRVGQSAAKINGIRLGQGFGSELVEQFDSNVTAIEARAKTFADSLTRILKAGASSSGGLGGIRVGGPDLAFNTTELAKEGIQQLEQGLRSVLSALPPELDALRPQLVSIVRTMATELVAALRKTEISASDEIKKLYGATEARPYVGVSSVTNVGNSLIRQVFPLDQATPGSSGPQASTQDQLAQAANQLRNAAKELGDFIRTVRPGGSVPSQVTQIPGLLNQLGQLRVGSVDRASVLSELGIQAKGLGIQAQGDLGNYGITGEDAEKVQEHIDALNSSIEALSQFTAAAREAAGITEEVAAGDVAAGRTGAGAGGHGRPPRPPRAGGAGGPGPDGRYPDNPNFLQSFFGGLTSRGYDAPGVGLSAVGGSAGVLARYGAAGAGIGALYTGLAQLKEGIVGVDQAETELNIALSTTGARSIDTSQAFSGMATAGIDASTALQTGAEALIVFQSEIKNSNDATEVFNNTVEQSGVLALNAGINIKQAAQELTQAALGFQTGSAGFARINDAIINARQNFGGNAADIAQAVAGSAPEARIAGVTPEEQANILSLVQSRSGLSGSTLTSGFNRLVARSGTGTFRQAETFAGVTPTGNMTKDIVNLSEAYKGMSQSQQLAFESQLAQARSLQFLLPLLQQGDQLTQANAKSNKGAGAAYEDFQKRINSIAGELKSFGATLKDVFQNVGSSGLFAGFGGALEILKQMLSVVNQLLVAYKAIPGPIREAVGLLISAKVALEAIKALRNTNFGRFIPNVPGRERFANDVASGTAGAEAAGVTTVGGVAIPAAGGEVANLERAAQLEIAAHNKAAAEVLAQAQAEADARIAQTSREIRALEVSTEEEMAVREELRVELQAAATAEAEQILATGRAMAGELQVAGLQLAATIREVGVEVEASGLGTAVGRASTAVRTSRLGQFLGQDLGVAGGNLGTAIGARSFGGILGAAAPFALAGGVGLATYYGLNSARRRIDATESQGYSDLNRQVDLGDLKTSASRLSQAASNINAASGGFVGTITGALDEFFGGTNRGAEAALLRRQAAADTAGAAAISRAQGDPLSGGINQGTTLDFSSVQNLGQSLQDLVAQGRSATDVIGALNARLEQMNEVASTGSRVLLTGQAPLLAANAGVAIRSNVFGDLADLNQANKTPSGFGRVGQLLTDLAPGSGKGGDVVNALTGNPTDATEKLTSRLLKIDPTKFQDAVQGDIEKELQRQGADQGKKIDTKALFKVAEDSVRKSLHLTVQQYNALPAQLRESLDSAATAGVAQGLTKTVGDRSTLSASQLQAVATQYLQFSPQAGQEAAAQATASGDSRGAGVVGAQTTLDDLKKGRDLITQALKKPGQKAKDIQNELAQLDALNAAIVQANNGVIDATVAELQVMGDLAASALPAGDKLGRINDQLKTLASEQQKYKPGSDEYKKYQTQINNLQDQANDQRLANSASANLVGLDPRDQVGKLKKASENAVAAYNDAKERGFTGADLNNAKIAADAAQVAYFQGLVQDANSRRDSAVAIGDVRGAANAKVQDAFDTANTDLKGSAQQAADFRTFYQDYYDAQITAAQFVGTQAQAQADPRDAVAQAQAQMTAATAILNTASKDDPAYWQAFGQYLSGQAALSKAIIADASTVRQLGEDMTNPITAAQETLQTARDQLAQDLAHPAKDPASQQRILNADRLAIQTDTIAEQKTTFDTQLQAVQDQYDLQRSSGAQYIQSLRQLRASILGNSYQAQQERIKIDKALKDAYGNLSGQFNLGDIKVPSVYEVRRSISAGAAGQQFSNTNTTSIVINGIGSTQEVVQIVKQQLGTVAVNRSAPTAQRRY